MTTHSIANRHFFHDLAADWIRLGSSLLILFGVLLSVVLCPRPAVAQAGTLAFYDAAVGPGATRFIPSPASEVLLDIRYAPASGEGGGLYGFSEVAFFATGDLTLTTTNFFCGAPSCLHDPLPFTAGQSIRITGGADLAGEFTPDSDLIRISVSGTNGIVLISTGEYIDSTGPSGTPGAIRPVESLIVATVPEPSFGLSLALATGLLLLGARRR